ncbi:MAG TPA: hypothetical protein VJ924_00760 [Alphaproteobacteria bacterium]|nr:hypothetical protein [Alphaproteobacteria bacterium]
MALPLPANDNPTPPLLRAVRWATVAAAGVAVGLIAIWFTG